MIQVLEPYYAVEGNMHTIDIQFWSTLYGRTWTIFQGAGGSKDSFKHKIINGCPHINKYFKY